MSPVMTCQNVSKSYGEGELKEQVLHEISLQLEPGQACVLLGPSGSGKTTLLSILGCLLAPSNGQLLVEGQPVNFSDKASLTEVRRQKLGFIFQHAQLLPFFTVTENLRVTGQNAGLDASALEERITDLLSKLGLKESSRKHPSQLSGGQRQRVAIARALLHKPSIVLADEPTAALDWHHGKVVVELLLEQVRREHAMLVMVTHDTRLVPLFDRVLRINDGKVEETTGEDSYVSH
jgi:putative ABC transport system ATP-binding protein